MPGGIGELHLFSGDERLYRHRLCRMPDLHAFVPFTDAAEKTAAAAATDKIPGKPRPENRSNHVPLDILKCSQNRGRCQSSAANVSPVSLIPCPP